MSRPTFAGVELSEETILATREHYAQISRDIIADVKAGRLRHSISHLEQRIEDSLAGKGDHSLAFLQRAYWIQTGEDIALLP